jgi:hypothetical protein
MKTRQILAAFLAGCVLALPLGLIQGQESDSDHDGVPNARDRCPNTAQLKKLPADFRFGGAVNPDRVRPGPQALDANQNLPTCARRNGPTSCAVDDCFWMLVKVAVRC